MMELQELEKEELIRKVQEQSRLIQHLNSCIKEQRVLIEGLMKMLKK